MIRIVFLPTDFLGQELDNYMATLSVPVHVERMGTRSGLIRARLRGYVLISYGVWVGWFDDCH